MIHVLGLQCRVPSIGVFDQNGGCGGGKWMMVVRRWCWWHKWRVCGGCGWILWCWQGLALVGGIWGVLVRARGHRDGVTMFGGEGLEG